MTKVLLTKSNSAWGVIVNPISDNTYRHILQFNSPEIKDEFISSNLFQKPRNFNWRSLFDNVKPVAFTRTSSTKATFLINVKDYPDESINSLINKDTAVIYEDGQYSFWVVRANYESSNPNIISFEAEYDIFFNLDIRTDIFPNSLTTFTEVIRAHVDRWKYTVDGLVPSFIDDYENPMNQPQIMTDESNLIHSNKINLDYNYQFVFNPNIPFTLEQQKNIINTSLKRMRWYIFYTLDKRPDSQSKVIFNEKARFYQSNSKNDIRIPNNYRLNVVPWDINRNILIKDNFSEYLIDGNFIEVINNLQFCQEIIPNTATVSMNCPFDLSTTKISVGLFNSQRVIKIDLQNSESLLANFITIKYDNPPETEIIGAINVNSQTKPFEMKVKIEYPNIDLDINSLYDWKQESILYKSPYNFYRIKSASGESFDIQPEYITPNFSINHNHSFTPEYAVDRYYPFGGIYTKEMAMAGARLDYLHNYFIPAQTNEYFEYLVRNKNTLNHQQNKTNWNNSWSLAGAIAGSLINPFKLFSIPSLVSQTSLESENLRNQMKDLINTPNSSSFSSSLLTFDDATLDSNGFALYNVKLLPNIAKQLADITYKKGVSFNNTISNIFPLIQTRYYFNHIQLAHCYENINTTLSSEIKQIIDTSFKNGITIWWVRDLNTFKGMLNYSVNNLELSLLANKNVKN